MTSFFEKVYKYHKCNDMKFVNYVVFMMFCYCCSFRSHTNLGSKNRLQRRHH